MRPPLAHLVVLVPILPSIAPAQSGVAPPSLERVWGNTGTHVPFGQSIYREQLLVPAAALPPGMVGRSIVSLGVRQFPGVAALPGAQVETEVRLYNVPFASGGMSRTFAQNRAAGTGGLVWQRRLLQLPALSADRGPAQSGLDLPLDAPFPCTGPNLLVEIVGYDTAQRFNTWVNDMCLALPRGSKATFGSPCGPTSNAIDSQSTGTVPYLPGAVVTVTETSAPPSRPVGLLVGVDLTALAGVPLPLDLGPAGAPGCRAFVAPEFVLGGVSNATGATTRTLPIPNQPVLAGRTVAFQWVNDEPAANAAGLSFSAGHQVTIGPVVCPMTTLFRLDDNLDTTGDGPSAGVGPVLRFAWR